MVLAKRPLLFASEPCWQPALSQKNCTEKSGIAAEQADNDMVLRTFFAIDNENLIVTSSSNSSLIGNPIINNSNTPNGTVFQFGGNSFREITLDDTGGGTNRFNDNRPDDHTIVDGGGLVDDGTGVEAESEMVLRELDANGNPTGPEITIYVLSKDGDFSDIWGIGLTAPLTSGASYVKISGSNTGTVRYNQFIACFTAGTIIKTPHGNTPVETIKKGQMVWTKRDGPQPIRWVGHRKVRGEGALAPVVIEAGALGNNRDLVVSQQHRVWFQNAAAELYFGQPSVLVAAKHLCGLPGITIQPQEEVIYTHIMFDRHQIVRSNGVLTESFFLADQSVSTLEEGPRAELVALFPNLQEGVAAFGTTAAPTLTGREAEMLKHYLVA